MNEQQIIKYLQEVTQSMLGTVLAADLTKAGADAVVIRKLQNILSQFNVEITEVLPRHLILEYFGGVDEATKIMAAAGATVATTKAITGAGMISRPFQKNIHLEAVKVIVDDAMNDIARAIATTNGASAASIATTVERVKGDMAKGLITGDTRRVMTGKVMESFLKDGLTAFTVIDRNGRSRSLPLNFYAETVTTSKTRLAHVTGAMNRYKDAGHDLVQIMGNGDSCAKCSQFRGMVVSMEGKTPGYPVAGAGGIELPPYHPRCRCGVSVFILDLSTSEEIAAAQEVNDGFVPGKDRRTPAQKAAYDREQAARRRANAELKQFQRYQAALGAEAPKTLPAFRRMKRADTAQYNSLKSQYASYAQSNRQ